MTTLRDAQAEFEFWSDRLYALDKSLYAVALKGDRIDTERHLFDLRVAKISKQRAHEQLETIRGRFVPVNHRSVPKRAIVTSSLTLKGVDAQEREIRGIASTPEVDHVGDRVLPRGAVYRLPLPLLWQHKSDLPVGRVIKAEVRDDGIAVRARIAKIEEPGELKNLVDRAWHSVIYGLVNGLSIGFQPMVDGVQRMADGGMLYSRWTWLELSLVTIAANASARLEVAA